MNIEELYQKKWNNEDLDSEEIFQFVQYLLSEDVDRAICKKFISLFSELSNRDMVNFVSAICKSGKKMPLKHSGELVDKSSIGGINDVVSLITLPLLASLGFYVAKINFADDDEISSLDRLHLIDGLQTQLSKRKIDRIMDESHMCFFEVPQDMMPAYKVLRELLKEAKMADNIYFKTIFLVCKKVMLGVQTLALDIKCGEGCVFATMVDAENYAEMVRAVCKEFDIAVITNIVYITEPLMKKMGLRLELEAAINMLSNRIKYKSSPFFTNCKNIVSSILMYTKKCNSKQEANKMISTAMESGLVLEKFMQMVMAQGGDLKYFDTPDELINNTNCVNIFAESAGYMQDVDVVTVKKVIDVLGGGKDENGKIKDDFVGIEILVSEGDKVKKNQLIAKVYFALSNAKFAKGIKLIKDALIISRKKPNNAKRKRKYANV